MVIHLLIIRHPLLPIRPPLPIRLLRVIHVLPLFNLFLSIHLFRWQPEQRAHRALQVIRVHQALRVLSEQALPVHPALLALLVLPVRWVQDLLVQPVKQVHQVPQAIQAQRAPQAIQAQRAPRVHGE